MQKAQVIDVIYFALAGGVVSLMGGIILLSRKKFAETFAHYATPFAAGALLGAVFLDLIPDGVKETSINSLMWGALVGIVGFFFMERVFSWFHHHHGHPEIKQERGRNLPLIITGNSLHNLLDGVAIGASFLISVPTGIVTTVAVAAHEIPHEIGDFGLMLARGMSRKWVILTNVLVALGTVGIAAFTFLLGGDSRFPVGLLLGISAGFLLYIAMSDIIPSIHENMEQKRKLFDIQAILLILGVALVAVAIAVAHRIESSAPESAETSTMQIVSSIDAS